MLHKVIIVAQMLHVLTQKNNFPLKIYEIILNELRNTDLYFIWFDFMISQVVLEFSDKGLIFISIPYHDFVIIFSANSKFLPHE